MSSSSPLTAAAAAVALAPAVPNYEVKVFLDARKVLDIEFKPTRAAQRTLDLGDSNRKIAMQFVDARPFRIHGEGWNIRVRRFEDKDELEIGYKRRYPLGSVALEEVLAVAAGDGFHGREDSY